MTDPGPLDKDLTMSLGPPVYWPLSTAHDPRATASEWL